ncbi:hypothetical protein QF046_000152 [Microbacterium sp. W4I4]|uniref:hypothetical protein n=1 Tax=Microbacterium sp. W4I4 TaxID=3042295 RepID=UPI002788FE4D|nr:hypothetical protein [Microbacterium sp. W4I4]MDQ0612511.1 hypothetical protein [Microbacterium sp. W4I4]
MRILRTLGPPLGIAVLLGIALTAVGMRGEYAWGWAVLGAAIMVAVRMMMPDDPRADAPGHAEAADYVGSDVSRLAWAISIRTDTVNEAVTRRIRATLRRRLLRHGVDVDDELQADAVNRLLGDDLWARLTSRRTRIGDLRDAIAAAERLVTSQTQDSTKETS